MARTSDVPWTLLLLLFAASRKPWWEAPTGGKGAGKGATVNPVPGGAATVWSPETMRLFVDTMRHVPVDPEVVLLAIAAASNFDATTELGPNHSGLLLLSRDVLREVGYPDVVPFATLDAPEQIPWIGKVIAYRIANTGNVIMSVPDLAVTLYPPDNARIEKVVRSDAHQRAERARGTMLYLHYLNVLRATLAAEAKGR